MCCLLKQCVSMLAQMFAVRGYLWVFYASLQKRTKTVKEIEEKREANHPRFGGYMPTVFQNLGVHRQITQSAGAGGERKTRSLFPKKIKQGIRC